MTSITDRDDPFDWSTDRVIQELCHIDYPDWATLIAGYKPLHNPAAVEQSLRENDIDGDALLNLQDQDIRSDLNITSYGQRHRFKKVVSHLRSLSRTYRSSAQLPTKSEDQISDHFRHSQYSGSPRKSAGPQSASHPPPFPSQSFSAPVGRQEGQANIRPSVELHNHHGHPQIQKNILNNDLLDGLESHVDTEVGNGSIIQTALQSQKPVSGYTYIVSDGRKRRRIEPTNISSTPSMLTRSLTPVNDGIQTGDEGSPTEEHVLQMPLDTREHTNHSSEGVSSKQNLGTLLKSKINGVNRDLLGADPSPNRKSPIEGSIHIDPQRVAAKTVKDSSYRNSMPFKAIQTGPLYSDQQTDITANTEQDQNLEKLQNQVNAEIESLDYSDSGSADSSIKLTDAYQSLLEKYPDNDEDNDILPPYGDSDDEDKYVTEGSISDIEEPVELSQQMPLLHLSIGEVDAVIDEAILNFKADYAARKYLKAQKVAHGKWMIASGVPGAREVMLKTVRTHQQLASKRLSRLRSAIHDSTWAKKTDLIQQCDCLSATIDLLEQTQYQIQVLESEREPPVPPSGSIIKKSAARQILPEGEDTCESDDDNLDGFISPSPMEESSENEGSLLDDSAYKDVDPEPSVTMSASTNNPPQRIPTPSPQSTDYASDIPYALPSKGITPTSQNEMNIGATISDNILEIQDNGDVTFSRHETSPSQGTQPVALLNHQIHQSSEVISKTRMHAPQTPPRSSLQNGLMNGDGESGLVRSNKRSSSTERRVVVDKSRPDPLSLPHLTESSDNLSDNESDLDGPGRPRFFKRQEHGPHSMPHIDLTLSSSPAPSTGQSDLEVRTPELNPSEAKRESINKDGATFNNLPQPLTRSLLSSLPDVSKIRAMEWQEIIDTNSKDGCLALAKRVYDLDPAEAQNLLSYIRSFKRLDDIEDLLKNGIRAVSDDNGCVPQIPQVPTNKQKISLLLTVLFIVYATISELQDFDDVTPVSCVEAWELLSDVLPQFHDVLVQLLQQFLKFSKNSLLQRSNSSAMSQAAEYDTGTDSMNDLPEDERPFLKRKRDSTRSSMRGRKLPDFAVDSQRAGKLRMIEQERRKAELAKKMIYLNHDSRAAIVPVNFVEPIVYLDGSIASRARPHQIEGIQFMWRELIEDPKQQGCLLAHTMGLGKTMQVISVLATIAQCNRSSDQKLVEHIPKHLRNPNILIVCPPTLIDNWFEEMIAWLPQADCLGPIYKITSKSKNPRNDIVPWAETGGVLILGYQRLNMYCNPSKDSRKASERDEKMKEWLTTVPNIVVADEAHELRNPHSAKAKAVASIGSKTRIALTGSPLSNHLQEYWAMINFVAPGYLGSMEDFKDKFVRPIESSLKSDSAAYERRVGLKKMHVLKRILGPKIHRADISAIQKDLGPKTEFFITIPLTNLQKKAYELYVRHFRNASRDGQVRSGNQILAWVAVLSLLLNHPYCFARKLEPQKLANEEKTSRYFKRNSDVDGEDLEGGDELPEDVDVLRESAAVNVADQIIEIFMEHAKIHSMDDPGLSYRSLLVKGILEEALKLGEKTLIFSHSIPTLDYLGLLLQKMKCKFDRLDGSSATDKRQKQASDFNSGAQGSMVFLISTRAGGLGLNLQGATRVIIYDYGWNPAWEEQAIGRAYRIGQKEPVFVYRFKAGGTFEDITFNSAVFKTQLFSRIIDHKSILRKGTKDGTAEKYLFDPKDPVQQNFDECRGKDPHVLDQVLQRVDCVRGIDLTETFAQDIDENLTEEEIREANQELEQERLQRENPEAYRKALDAERSAMLTTQPNTGQSFGASPGFASTISRHLQSISTQSRTDNSTEMPSVIPKVKTTTIETRSSYDDNVRSASHASSNNKLARNIRARSISPPSPSARDVSAQTSSRNIAQPKADSRSAQECKTQ